MTAVVVFAPRGAFIDGLTHLDRGAINLPTQAVLSSGGVNTGNTVRVTTTLTTATDGSGRTLYTAPTGHGH